MYSLLSVLLLFLNFQSIQLNIVVLNLDFTIPLTFPTTLETWIKIDLPDWDVAL